MYDVVIIRAPKMCKKTLEAIKEHSKHTVKVVNTSQLARLKETEIHDSTVVVRWGSTATLPPFLRKNVLNKSVAIHKASNKLLFRKTMLSEHFPGAVPTFWEGTHESNLIKTVGANTPLVVRPEKHYKGQHFFIVNNSFEFVSACEYIRAYFGMNYYASPLINKIKEYRVYVFKDKCFLVKEKIPREGKEHHLNWNVENASFVNVKWNKWPIQAIKYSIKAVELCGLDFGAVDIIYGNMEGNRVPLHFVLEINTSPTLTGEYGPICFARVLNYYLNQKIVERFPIFFNQEYIEKQLKEYKGGFSKFLHPALKESR